MTWIIGECANTDPLFHKQATIVKVWLQRNFQGLDTTKLKGCLLVSLGNTTVTHRGDTLNCSV